MLAIGRRYVQYINRSYRRTGSLWEGRYKSSLIQAETYLLTCMRYIELQPRSCRHGARPRPIPLWSSYRHTAMARPTYASPRIRSTSRQTGKIPTGKPLTGRYSAASWMQKPWMIFDLPCHKGSRWAMAVSAKGYVPRQAFGVARSDQDDLQARRISPAIRIRKLALDFEQQRRG
jgi:hypothetical protein